MAIAPRAGASAPAFARALPHHASRRAPRQFRAGVSTLVIATSLVFAPGAALALTAAEAWQNWQDTAAANDIALSAASEAGTGQRLVVTEVAFASETAEGTTVTGVVSEITFLETGDGAVSVVLPDEIPVTVTGESDLGESLTMAFLAAQTGLEMTISEDGTGGTILTSTAPDLTLTLESIAVDGEPQEVEIAATLSGMAAENAVGAGDVPAVSSSFSADRLDIAMSGVDAETGGTFSFDVAAADIASENSGRGSALLSMSGDLAEAIEAGFATSGAGSIGAVSFALKGEDLPETFDIEGRLGGGQGRVVIDAEQIDYEVSYSDLGVEIAGDGLPMARATASLGDWQTRVALPASPADEAAPIALTLALRDLVLGEEVWALFDPAGVLSRDPATLIVDLAGSARILDDIFGAEQTEPQELPIEVDRLDVSELRLALAGAELTGQGGFTFDWSAPGPFGPGTPAPDGTLMLMLSGGEALLQGLTRMGLIDEQQAMMTRMMTGMLALPGDAPDTLVSEITVRPDGTVLANGAPLPF